MAYITVIEPVLEITLSGTVDRRLWQDRLQAEGLADTNQQGCGVVMLSAVDARFKGVRFQELSISYQVGDNHYFLVYTYNSIQSLPGQSAPSFASPTPAAG